MKKLILGLFLLTSLSAFAQDFVQMAGTYEVTIEGAPIINIIEIGADGTLSLVENSPYGSFKCEGAASIDKGVISSEMTCENGMTFSQRIDVNGVENFDKFTANVYSSLYGEEVPMNFKRI